MYDIVLDNNDLEEILKTPATKGLIHKRLLTDFNPKSMEKNLLSIEFPNNSTETNMNTIIPTANNLLPIARGYKKKSHKKKSYKKCRMKNGKFKKCTYKKKI
jgi:hypothetical protein